MIYLRTYRIFYRGHRIGVQPLHHSWWARLKARLQRLALPAVRYQDWTEVTLRIQGPSKAALDAEIRVREQFHLAGYRRIDPKAEHRHTVLLCEGQNLLERPLPDRSGGQSQDYRHWLAGFSKLAPGPVIEDHKDCGSIG